MTNTNNRLEAINQKIKAVVCRYSPIRVFFADLMTCIFSIKLEREHRAVSITLKRPVGNWTHPCLGDYSRLLTPFAFKHVKQQFQVRDKVIFSPHEAQGQKMISSKRGDFITDVDDCPCHFRTSMLLPCRHIFAVREAEEIDMFSSELCAQRWHVDYFTENHYAFEKTDGGLNSTETFLIEIEDVERERGRSLTEQEKFAKALKVAQDSARVMSHMGTRDFVFNLKALKKQNTLLSKGKRITVDEFKGFIPYQDCKLKRMISFVSRVCPWLR